MTPVPNEHRALLRRLHSLTGVFPLGLFFVAHLLLNATALQGSRAFDLTVRRVQAWPGLLGLELLGIHLPLLIHAALGITLTARTPGWIPRGPTREAWSSALQRVTGALTLLFVAYHLGAIRIPLALGELDPTDLRPLLVATLSSTTASGIPLHAVVYLVGIASASYHLGNGLGAYGASRIGATSPRKASIVRGASMAAAGALFVLGALTVLHYATGSTFGLGSAP
jgi:succinate dehydrogenase / fumarate reductase cytochrome b subunit